jgi:hypothetical protein
VNRGRAKLSFSQWSKPPAANARMEICDAVSDGSMPFPAYTVLHHDARLSRQDVALRSFVTSQDASAGSTANRHAERRKKSEQQESRLPSRVESKGVTMFLTKTVQTAFVLVIPLVTIALMAAGQDSRRVIEVVADKDNTFKVGGESKPIITVKPVERIIVRITTHFGGEQARDGSVHSFVVKKLSDQGWDIRLKKGRRTTR